MVAEVKVTPVPLWAKSISLMLGAPQLPSWVTICAWSGFYAS
jgi:hypothetical protein